MNTTNSSENQHRRVEGRKPAETIDWAAPDAPAVPLQPPAAARANLPIRYVASLLVNASGASVFTTPDAERLPHGHYMLSAGAVPQSIAHPIGHLSPTSIESPIGAPAATSGDAPAAYMYQDDADVLVPGTGSCFISRARMIGYKNETPLYARIERAASPATASGDELPPLPERHDELTARWQCDACDGRGHDGEAHYQGHFQPPEPFPCSACGGNGTHPTDAYTAEQMRAYARAAVSAATKPAADLSKLTRYGWKEAYIGDDSELIEDAEGTYVRFADVQSLLATKPAGAPVAILREALNAAGIKGEARHDILSAFCHVWNAAPTAAPADQVRNQALEEAAQICDERHHNWRFGDGEDSVSGPKECAERIRALKSSATQTIEGAGNV